MRCALCLLPLVILAAPGMASAADAASEASAPAAAGAPAPADKAAPASSMDTRERRDGLVIGLMGGYGLGGASGYPNAASKIDDPNYYSASDLLVGNGSSLFIMGALADYANVGFWFGGGVFESKHWRSTGGGAGLRVELFPLYILYPKLRDLGVVGQFGIGSSKLESKIGDYPAAVGTQSFLGVGLFYEFKMFRALGGHAAGGPSFEYDVIASRSMERHGAMLGGRIAFYGGI